MAAAWETDVNAAVMPDGSTTDSHAHPLLSLSPFPGWALLPLRGPSRSDLTGMIQIASHGKSRKGLSTNVYRNANV